MQKVINILNKKNIFGREKEDNKQENRISKTHPMLHT